MAMGALLVRMAALAAIVSMLAQPLLALMLVMTVALPLKLATLGSAGCSHQVSVCATVLQMHVTALHAQLHRCVIYIRM